MNKDLQIKVEHLTPDLISYVNEFTKSGAKVVLIFKNTKGIKTNDINKFENNNLIYFQVIGGLNKEKYNKERYKERITYSLVDFFYIVKELENIEASLNPNISDYDKAKYIYNLLAHNIKVCNDYDISDKWDEIQSLKGLISKQAVCAGYSLIYKELMDRQGIKCEYVRGRNTKEKHAWNILEIDGNIYPVDLTNEAVYCQRNPYSENNNRFFGVTEEFVTNHFPEQDEFIIDYNNLLNQNDCKKETKKDKELSLYYRNDGSCFYLCLIGENNKESNYSLFKYMQCEVNKDGSIQKTNVIYSEQNIEKLNSNLKNTFINELLDKKRIEECCSLNKGYIGYVSQNKDGNIGKFMNPELSKELPFSKTLTRLDGSNINLSFSNNQDFINNGVIEYDCCEFVKTENNSICIKVDKIYTEMNILKDNNLYYETFFATNTLNRKRIDDKVSNNAGYVGTVMQKGNKLIKVVYPNSQSIIESQQDKFK